MDEETTTYVFEWNPPKMIKKLLSWIKSKLL